MIKKFLQKIFKIVSYAFFLKVYGKIEKSIESSSDSRIKVKILDINKNLRYRVYKIANGRLYTDRIHDTAVILDNKIIKGPSFQLRYTYDRNMYDSKIEDNVVFQKGTPRKLKKLNSSVLSLLTGGAGNNNYWHWLFDVLPRFDLCSKVVDLTEIDYFLLPSLLKKFQEGTLDHLNIPKNKRLSSEKFRHIKVKELIVTDHPVVVTGNATKDIQDIPKWIIKWLKRSFINQNVITNKKIKNKIYIDRKETITDSAPYRFIKNEKDIKGYLLKNNFTLVNLADIEFNEQVNLFHNADCIIGLHGAGFANLVFCKPGTRVIELKSSNSGPVIENLAKKNDLNYYSIITEAEQTNKFNFPNQQGSIQIPVNNLIKILEN